MSTIISPHETCQLPPMGLDGHLARAETVLNDLRGTGWAVDLPVALRHTEEQEDVPRRCYNVSGLLDNNILARTEPPQKVEGSQIRKFSLEPGRRAGLEDTLFIPMELEDPAIAKINGEVVVSGVRVVRYTLSGQEQTDWYTEYYRGPDLHNLTHFASSPYGEKDNRLLQRENGQILLLSRPRGGVAGLGTIAVSQFDTPDELTPELISNATLLTDMFLPEEWGGANHMYELDDGWVGVLGHIANRKMDPRLGMQMRTYCGMVFELQPDTLAVRNLHVVADSDMFPGIDPWIPDLPSAVFPAGLEFHDKNLNTVRIFAGINDNGVGVAEIPYPFTAAVRL